MLTNRLAYVAVVLAAALVVGCEKKAKSPTTAPVASGQGEENVPKMSTGSGTQQMEQQAQSLVDKVQKDIQDKNFDEAFTDLNQLEDMKSSLPPAMQETIDSLRQSYDTAQTSAGSPATQPTTQPTH